MARSKILLSLGTFAMLILAGCTKPTQTASPTPEATEPKRIASVDVVKPTVDPVELPVGGSAEVTVRLAIQSGYHANANPPTFSYLIPTELMITPLEGISAGAITYPPPIHLKLAFADEPLAVYEGNITIKATLKADKSAKPGEHFLAAKMRIQACDDQVCYPPGTRDLVIPVTIK